MVEKDKDILKFLPGTIHAEYRLLCIPYAGGGASFFSGWRKEVNENMDLLAVQLPGHEERFGEEFVSDIYTAASQIADVFEDEYKDKPFSVFGHSMGGLIGFETVKELEKRGIMPDYFFVSSTSIEDMSNIVKSTELDDDAFLQRVMLFGGIDKDSEALKYNEFFRMYLKILRADFGIIEAYTNDGEKIKTPICAMCGTEDPMESIEKMQGWKELTESEYTYKEFPGDHFYLKNQVKQVMSLIMRTISLKKFG